MCINIPQQRPTNCAKPYNPQISRNKATPRWIISIRGQHRCERVEESEKAEYHRTGGRLRKGQGAAEEEEREGLCGGGALGGSNAGACTPGRNEC